MQQFKDKVYNYETAPPADAWNKIKGELKSSNIFPIKAKRTNFRIISAAAAAVVIIMLIVFFTYKNQSSILTVQQQSKDSMRLNNQALEEIITASKENKPITRNKTALSKIKKYLTVAGPEGRPVRISSKVATLIVSADNGYPPKPVWNKKIEKWKQIMLTSTLSPTSTNLLDVAENSSGGVDNNE